MRRSPTGANADASMMTTQRRDMPRRLAMFSLTLVMAFSAEVAQSTDGEKTLGLLLGSEGRLKYLDIYTPNHGRLPNAEDLFVLP